MPEETNNSVSADGSAGSSPPASPQATAGESQTSGDSSSVLAASERAPGESQNSEIDPLDEIYDQLQAKAEARTNDSRSASPASSIDTQGDPSAAPVAANQQTTGATNKDGKQQQRQTAEYAGLTPDARGLLKSTNLLIAPEQWNAMPEMARSSLIESAKSIRAEKERLFQEKTVQQGQQANQQQQQQQQQNRNPNPQAQGNQQMAAPEVDKAFGELEKFGADLANPIRQVFQHQQQQFNGHIEQLTRNFTDALGTRDEQIKFLMQRLEKGEEHAAFEGDELKTLRALPEFKTKEVRDEINRNARALLRAQFGAGNRDYTLKEALIAAANTKFFDKQQQAAQAALAESRKNSLRGTSARAAAIVPANKPTPRTETKVMDEVYDELYARASK